MAKPQRLKPIPEELTKKLQQVADVKDTTIISFVAPRGVRTSPVTIISAEIEETEIYRIEKIVEEAISKKATKNLHLVVHTPGGEMHATYKMANFLRDKFTNISVFVPYQAASGGTILCCAANQLFISGLGNLTAFDPQVRYKGVTVSCNAFLRSVDFIKEEWGEIAPDEMPSPWQQMADKLDPIIYDTMSTALFTAITCATRLLEKSGYDKQTAASIALKLGMNGYTHGLPIFVGQAKEMGFNTSYDEGTMNVYKELVSWRRDNQWTSHITDEFFPKKKKAKGGKK